jgi:hypothetical protein
MLSLLRAHRDAFVFHGHIHKEVTRAVAPTSYPQVFCARATVDSDVLYRLYDVEDQTIVPVEGLGADECFAEDAALAAE